MQFEEIANLLCRTHLVGLSQTRDTLQQLPDRGAVAHKDIRYDELYQPAQDCHRQGLTAG